LTTFLPFQNQGQTGKWKGEGGARDRYRIVARGQYPSSVFGDDFRRDERNAKTTAIRNESGLIELVKLVDLRLLPEVTV
jgi:hypothetical protein